MGMKKTALLSILVVAIQLTVGALAEAQQPKKLPRIGYLSVQGPAGDFTRNEAIRLALRELGYVDGQNITTEYLYAEGKRDRLPELAAELVRLKVDLIVVSEPSPALAAKNATTTIPIVMTTVRAPVDTGFWLPVSARPGGNATGLASLGLPAKYEKACELMCWGRLISLNPRNSHSF